MTIELIFGTTNWRSHVSLKRFTGYKLETVQNVARIPVKRWRLDGTFWSRAGVKFDRKRLKRARQNRLRHRPASSSPLGLNCENTPRLNPPLSRRQESPGAKTTRAINAGVHIPDCNAAMVNSFSSPREARAWIRLSLLDLSQEDLQFGINLSFDAIRVPVSVL